MAIELHIMIFFNLSIKQLLEFYMFIKVIILLMIVILITIDMNVMQAAYQYTNIATMPIHHTDQ